MLLVVAIDRVSTMQLFVREALAMTYKFSQTFSQTVPIDDAEKVTNEPQVLAHSK